ncbi:MAG: hypothetical protein H7145_11675, partial [Akkermansiaceae bacterium]|nr:hypothetical protein [Armatimonadota bacterium]
RKVIFVDVPWSGTSDNGQGNFSFSARIHGRHAGGVACVLWADGHVKGMRPVFRANPAGPIATRRGQKIGELSPVPLPDTITASDPDRLRYNYYYALDKEKGF